MNPANKEELYKKVDTALETLSDIKHVILRARFPMSGENGKTHEEIALELDLPVSEVKDLEARALRELRGSRNGFAGAHKNGWS